LIAEPLFLLADSAIVGRLGTTPLGGLGVAAQALTTLVNISIFLAYGTTAAVARQLGAGNRQAAIRQGMDGIWLAGAIGVAVLAGGLPLAAPIVRAFGADQGVTGQAIIYLRISLLGAPGMLAVLAGTGILRGLQDTRTPLIIAVGSNVANVVLNATFVLGLHWGIAGSAWGTVIAQNGAAIAYLAMVAAGARRAGVGLGFDLPGVLNAARTGGALVIRTLALQAVLVAATAIAARQGTVQIAAYQVSYRIYNVLVLALDAIAIAGQAITGKYLGAGDVAGTRTATRLMIRWGVGCGVVFGLLLLAALPVLPALFDATPPVARLMTAVLLVAAAIQPVAGVVFVLDGVLIGAGDQDYLALAGLVATAVFGVAAAVIVVTGSGVVSLWLAIAAWILARFVTLTWRARGDRWLVTGAVRSAGEAASKLSIMAPATGSDRISLLGLRAFGRHGVLPSEREAGQEFVIDAVLRLDLRPASATDDLSQTVSYAVLARRLTEIVGGKPLELIETLAERLAAACLEDERVDQAEVTVHKPGAPIGLPFSDVTVTVVRDRP
jgi:dihydroneopterin aldolase